MLQAPPECPAYSQVGSVLPPAPTVSSSHTCVNCESELAAVKVTTTPDNKSESSSSNDTNPGSDSQADSGGGMILIMTLTLIMILVATIGGAQSLVSVMTSDML